MDNPPFLGRIFRCFSSCLKQTQGRRASRIGAASSNSSQRAQVCSSHCKSQRLAAPRSRLCGSQLSPWKNPCTSRGHHYGCLEWMDMDMVMVKYQTLWFWQIQQPRDWPQHVPDQWTDHHANDSRHLIDLPRCQLGLDAISGRYSCDPLCLPRMGWRCLWVWQIFENGMGGWWCGLHLLFEQSSKPAGWWDGCEHRNLTFLHCFEEVARQDVRGGHWEWRSSWTPMVRCGTLFGHKGTSLTLSICGHWGPLQFGPKQEPAASSARSDSRSSARGRVMLCVKIDALHVPYGSARLSTVFLVL